MRHRLCPTVDPQFTVDVAGVDLDGADGDVEFIGDLSVRQSSRQQLQHFQFPVAERFHQRLGGR